MIGVSDHLNVCIDRFVTDIRAHIHTQVETWLRRSLHYYHPEVFHGDNIVSQAQKEFMDARCMLHSHPAGESGWDEIVLTIDGRPSALFKSRMNEGAVQIRYNCISPEEA